MKKFILFALVLASCHPHQPKIDLDCTEEYIGSERILHCGNEEFYVEDSNSVEETSLSDTEVSPGTEPETCYTETVPYPPDPTKVRVYRYCPDSDTMSWLVDAETTEECPVNSVIGPHGCICDIGFEAVMYEGVLACHVDICITHGLYGDGNCDTICIHADPDCEETNPCP